MNKRSKILILTVLVFIWMGIIYALSSQDATQSSNSSGVIVQAIIKLNPNIETMKWEERVQLEDTLQHMVRKTAHFAIYTIGGILLVALTTQCNAQSPKLAAWLLGTLYAATDEWHQYYVPGRSAEIRDVCIDALGVLVGIIIVAIIFKIIKNRERRKVVNGE